MTIILKLKLFCELYSSFTSGVYFFLNFELFSVLLYNWVERSIIYYSIMRWKNIFWVPLDYFTKKV
jgi:hypothetical protein